MRIVVRAVGGAIILLSIFLPWFFGASLYGIAALLSSGQLAGGPAGAVEFFYVVLFLVVAGGALSFVRRSGGVVAFVGAVVFTLFLMAINPVALAFMGAGVWVAIAGSIVVLASKRIAIRLQRLIKPLPRPLDD